MDNTVLEKKNWFGIVNLLFTSWIYYANDKLWTKIQNFVVTVIFLCYPILGAAHSSAARAGGVQHSLLPNGLFDFSCPYCNTPHYKQEALDLHIRCHVGQVQLFFFLNSYTLFSSVHLSRFLKHPMLLFGGNFTVK